MKKIKIGLFGFGTVGQGFYELVNQYNYIAEGNTVAEITRICIRDFKKNRTAPAQLFTTNPNTIFNDSEIDVVVEAISETEPAFEIVKEALTRGMPTVSASKKMLALHLPALISLQKTTHTPLRFEAAVGGAIPILNTLRQSLAYEPVLSIRGILNGTTNYILTKMRSENWDYATALAEAQRLGFAEADPTSDVQGWDAVYKICLLSWQTYRVFIHPEQVSRQGIECLLPAPKKPNTNDKIRLRLVAQASKTSPKTIRAQVAPEWVGHNDALYGIENELNAIQLNLAYSGTHVLSGKGAGGMPTASAVLADVMGIIREQYATLPIGKLY